MSEDQDTLTTPARADDLDAFLETVIDNFGDDAAVSLATVEQAGQELSRFEGQTNYREAQVFLSAAKDFFSALVLVQTTADFASAAALLERSAKGFSGVGIDNMAEASQGLHLYFTGVIDLQGQNLGRAIELLAQAQDHLEKAGDFGSRFRPLVDIMAAEQLFLAGLSAANKQDYPLARTLLEQAAQKAESLAARYAEAGTQTDYFFRGLAKFYRAHFETLKSWSDLSRFDLEWAMGTMDAGRTAREARELLSKADLSNPIQRNCYRMAGVISGVLFVLAPAARLIHALLANDPVPEVDYPGLRARLQEAENEAAEVGEPGTVLVRMCQQLGSMLDNLKQFAAARPKPAGPARAAAARKSHIRLFTIMPYNEDNKVVEEALRAVFEDAPYWAQVILASDRTLRKNLFENVKAHMSLVDGFIADISDLNPNVMMELGMTEMDPRQRPVFVLWREGSQTPPSDLKALLYVDYTLPKAGKKDRVAILAAELRKKLETIEDLAELVRKRQARYLSEKHVLSRVTADRTVITRDEIRDLQKAFLTIEELESADAAEIAAKTGLSKKLSGKIAQAFKTKPKGKAKPKAKTQKA